MCMTFKNINKACPNDAYPLVNATLLHETRRFIDVYSGYSHISMHPDYEAQTKFCADNYNLCYNATSVGLVNARATYQ